MLPATINTKGLNKRFIKAAKNNQLDELKNLLSRGAGIHANNNEALFCAVQKGHLDTIKFLITHGANIHAQDDFALIFSAFNDRLEIVKFLLSQGANIHAQDDGALRLSAQYGRCEIVKFLLIQGANIHANDDYALRWAKHLGHDDVWQVLSAFIQEKKLLVAASVSMPLVAASESTGASAWVRGTAVGSVAPVVAADSIIARCCFDGTPSPILSVVDVACPKQPPRTQRSKI